MREWPESHHMQAVLRRAGTRRRAVAILQAVTRAALIGAPVAAGLILYGQSIPMVAMAAGAVALAVMTVAHFQFDRSPAAVAADVERRAPGCRNVLVTAEALLRDAGATPEPVVRVVMYDAARTAAALELDALFPTQPVLIRALGAIVLLVSTGLLASPAVERLLPSLTTAAASAPVLSDVRITITPPDYSGQKVESHVNPERVAALVGSRVEVRASGPAAVVTMATTQASTTVARAADGTFSHSFTIDADGFVSLTPADDMGETGVRRLIGLTALPDRPPAPKVMAPGKDLFLKEATASLDLEVEATDDFGLRSLKVAYTRVAGVGESFSFTEGETPLTLEKTSDRQWKGRGRLSLQSLGLELGDMVVYRAVATDGRPGSTPVESDSYIVEIVSESEAMAEGFAIDDTRDKYAISQQMVILKTERLIARVASRTPPTAEAVTEEALTIAAEQRAVRAEIVFMMGGHFEDEFVEAAHEHEISDGRMDNSGRADLGKAIRDMSRAATDLVDGNLKSALEAEKLALSAMQRALSRRRFILRTLTQRESIDDTRRLTGKLGNAQPARRGADDALVTPEVTALRAALAVVSDVRGREVPEPADARRIAAAGEALLQAAPGTREIVDIVSALSTASEATANGRRDAARDALLNAATRMSARLRAAGAMSNATDDAETRRLKGALGDARRAGGGRD